MSSTIDQKIVEMQFDNAQFERNVHQTMGSLDSLKKKLDFSGASSSLSDLSNNAAKVDFSPIGGAVEKVGEKFNAFEQIAIGALRRIGEQAINAGENLLKSLSVDQISSGWEKFGDRAMSVSTLIAQGYDINTVNEELGKLNWFTDETSYNMSTMVQSIAKFTAVGQGLTESREALEGIALWAALSGQSAQTASSAMYQLSQAMGSGYMRREDWKSIQNYSMNTQEFEQNVLDAAVAIGTLSTGIDEATGEAIYWSNVAEGKAGKAAFNINQFAENLTDGMWFTTDVMMDVYKKYASATDEIYEYAKENNVTASQAIEDLGLTTEDFGVKAFLAGQQAKTFNDVLDSIKDATSTGWSNFFETIFGDYTRSSVLWTDLANTLYEVFATPVNDIVDLFEKAMTGIEGMYDGEFIDGIDILRLAITHIADAMVSFEQVVKEAWTAVFGEPNVESLKDFIINFEKFTSSLILTRDVVNSEGESFTILTETGEKLKRALSGIAAVIDIFKMAITAVLNPIKDLLFGEQDLAGSFLDGSASLGDFLVGVRDWIAETDIFNTAVSYVVTAIKWLIDTVKNIWNTINDFWSDLSGKGIIETLKSIKENVIDFVDAVKEKFNELFGKNSETASSMSSAKESFSKIFGSIKKMLEGLLKVIGSVWSVVKEVIPTVLEYFSKFADGIGEGAGAIAKLIDEGGIEKVVDLLVNFSDTLRTFNMSSFIVSLTGGIGSLKGVVDSFNGILANLGEGIDKFMGKFSVGNLIKVAVGLLILVMAISAMAKVDVASAYASVGALGIMLGEVVGALKLLELGSTSLDGKKLENTMLALSASVLILSFAVEKLANLPIGNMWSAVGAVTALVGVFVGFMYAVKPVMNDMDKFSVGLGGVAFAVKGFAKAIALLSESDPIQIAVSTAALSLLLGVLALTLRELPNGVQLIEYGIALVGIGVGMQFMGKAIAEIGTTSIASALAAALALGVLLVAIFAATLYLPDPAKLVAYGIALIGIGAGMRIVASAVSVLASLSVGDLVKGVVAFAAALGAIAIAMQLMPKGFGMLANSVGIIAIATSMLILFEAFKMLSTLSWENVLKGLVALTGALLAISVSMRLMKADSIFASAAILAIAAAMLILVPALKMLGGMSWESIIKGIVGFAAVVAVMAIGLRLLKPTIITLVGIAEAANLFGQAIEHIGHGVLEFAAGLGLLALDSIAAEAAVEGLKRTVIAWIEFIPEVLAALADALKNGASSLVKIFGSIIQGVLQGVDESIPEILDTVSNILFKILDWLNSNITRITKTLVEIVLNLVIGVVQGVTDRIPELIGSLYKLIKSIVIVTMDLLKNLSVEDILAFLTAFTALGTVLAVLGAVLAEAVVVTAMLPLIGLNISLFGLALVPFLKALELVDQSAIESALMVSEMLAILSATAIANGLTFFIDKGTEISRLGGILDEFAKYIVQFGTTIQYVDTDQVQAAALAGQMLASMANSLPRSGGLTGLIFGDTQDIKDFGSGLIELGKGLKEFGEQTSGISKETFDKAIDAADLLAKMSANLPKHGGLWQKIFGDNDLQFFADGITQLGAGLNDFQNETVNIKSETFENAGKCITFIADASAKLPKHNGLAQFFTGDNTLQDFAKGLASLGAPLAEFGKDTTNLNAETFEIAGACITFLADASAKLPKHGGLAQIFTGDNTLAIFAEELSAMAEPLGEFSSKLEDKPINTMAIISAGMAIQAMIILSKALPKEGGIVQWWTGENNLANFAAELLPLGMALSAFSNSVLNLRAKPIENAAAAALSLADLANNLPESGATVKEWFTGKKDISDFAKGLSDIAEPLMDLVEKTSDLDYTSVHRINLVSKALSALAEAEAALPKHGGIWHDWFVGDATLTSFATELEDIADPIKNLSSSLGSNFSVGPIRPAAEAVKLMAEAAAGLPSHGGIVKEWFTGDATLTTFAEELDDMGPSLRSFARWMSGGISTSDISSAADAIKTLATAATSLPDHGGIVKEWFTGDATLTTFAAELDEIGPSLADFSSAEIDADKVTAGATAIEALATAAAALPETGGIKSWFTGDVSLSKFGGELEALAPGLKTFSDDMDGFKAENVTSNTSAISALFTLLDDVVPKDGGILADIVGGNLDLTNWGTQLETLGSKLAAYSTSMVSVNSEVLTATTPVVGDLLTMCAGLPEIKKDINFGTLGESLAAFGPKFKEYADSLVGISTDNLPLLTEIVLATIGRFANSSKTLSDASGIFSKDLGDELVDFANDFVKYAKILTDGVAPSDLETAQKNVTALINAVQSVAASDVSPFNQLASSLETIGNGAVDDFVEAFDGAGLRFEEAGNIIVEKLILGVDEDIKDLTAKFFELVSTTSAALDASKETYYEIGKSFSLNLYNGMDEKWTEKKSEITQSVSSTTDVIKDYRSSFYEAGKYLAGGLIDGMDGRINDVSAAGRRLAVSAMNGLTRYAMIQSPSKLFAKLGGYTAQGYINGMEDYAETCAKAGEDIGSASFDGMRTAIDAASNLIENGVDSNPTIRPVIDLTNIQNGMATIDSMLASERQLVGSVSIGSLTAKEIEASRLAADQNSESNQILKDIMNSVSRIADNPENGMSNTFNIEGADPKEIAEEVSNILLKQFERRRNAWA